MFVIKRFNNISKKIFCCILSVVLIFGCVFMPNKKAYADENPFRPQSPWWFDPNGPDPYGYGEGAPFKIIENNELFYLSQCDNGSNQVSSIYDTLNSTESNTGIVKQSFKNTNKTDEDQPDCRYLNIPSVVEHMDYAHTAALDSKGNGCHDNVAIIGLVYDATIDNITYNHSVVVIDYDTVTKQWSDPMQITKTNWMSSDYSSFKDGDFSFQIVAGDFNHDHKDTFVAYACNYEDLCLQEFEVDNSNNKPVIKAKSKTSSADALLNPEYCNNSGSIYTDEDNKSRAKGSMRACLCAGDIDGDGVDDLAVLSYCYTTKTSMNYNYRAFLPYLSICKGEINGSNFLGDSQNKFGQYIINSSDPDDPQLDKNNSGSVESLINPWMTIGKVNNTPYSSNLADNSLIVNGYHATYQFDTTSNPPTPENPDQVYRKLTNRSFDGNSYGWKRLGLVKMTYDLSSDKTSPFSSQFTTQKINKAGIHEDFIQNQYERGLANALEPQSTQAVYMNGKGNAAYLELGGHIYEWTIGTDAPVLLHSNEFMDKDDEGCGSSTVCYNIISTSGTAVGCFDGNDKGYQQVIYTLVRQCNNHNCEKVYTTRAIVGTKYSCHDENGLLDFSKGDPFYDNEDEQDNDYEWGHHHAEPGQGFGIALCPIDMYFDGCLARYNHCDYEYSDPTVEVLLQAGPYFNGLHTSGQQGDPTTSVSIGQTVSVTKGDIDTVSFGVQVVGSHTGDFNNTDVGLGYALDWQKTFEHTETVNSETTYACGTKNCVVVSQLPISLYFYDFYDYTTGTWGDNNGSVVIQHCKEVNRYDINGFNSLVEKYNNSLYGKTDAQESRLKKITNQDFFTSNEGIPDNYPQLDPDPKNIESANGISGYKPFYTNTESNSLGNVGKSMPKDWSLTDAETTKEEMNHGFRFDIASKWGSKENKIGLGGWLNYTDGTSEATSRGQTIKYHWEVGDLNEPSLLSPEGKYFFRWNPCSWNSDQVIKKDDKNTYYAPVIGYATTQVSPSSKTTNTWTPPSGDQSNKITIPDQNFDVYKDTAPKSADINSLNKQQNSYSTQSTQTVNTSNLKQSNYNPFAATLAYADDDQKDVIKLHWDAPENAQNVKYQVYTCVNGQVLPVGDPISTNEFIFDPSTADTIIKGMPSGTKIDDLPLYQFSISVIDDQGQEGPRSSWTYYLSDKYFKDISSFKIVRNGLKAEKRLSFITKQGDKELSNNNADTISLHKNDSKGVVFSLRSSNNKTENTTLNLADGNQRIVKSIEKISGDGNESLFQVSFESPDNPSDTNSFILRINDGKSVHEKKLEKEILSKWSSPEEINAALNNPETYNQTAKELTYYRSITEHDDSTMISGEAAEVYNSGVSTLDNITKSKNSAVTTKQSGDINNFAVLIAGLSIAVIATCFIVYTMRKKKNCKANVEESK